MEINPSQTPILSSTRSWIIGFAPSEYSTVNVAGEAAHICRPGKEARRAGPQMRREPEIEGAGDGADLHRLADAAAEGRVRLEDVGGLEHGEVAECVARRLALAGSDRHVAGRAHFGDACLVVGDDRLLEPGEIAIPDHLDEALCVGNRVGAVRVDRQFDVRTDRLARCLHPRGRDMRRAVHRADAHLHGLEAALVDVGVELLADFVGGCPTARGIGRHALQLAPAEQPPDRHAERFAQDVPERDVDRRDRRHRQATARHLRHGVALAHGEIGADAVIEHLPDHADVAGMLADQLRADLMVQHMHQRAVVAGAAGGVLALSPADKPVIGLDAQDSGVEGTDLAEVAAMLAARFDRYPHPPGSDAA